MRELSAVVIRERLRYLKNNKLGIFQGGSPVIRFYAVPRYNRSVRIRSGIVNIKKPVCCVVRVKCQSQEPFFIAGIVHSVADVEKNRGCGNIHGIFKNLNDTLLLDNKKPVASVVRVLKIDRPDKCQIRKCLLEIKLCIRIDRTH